MKINLEEFKKREKYIGCRGHPTLPLWIWNYRHECQYDKAWDEYTMMARGLITDYDGNIIERPFKKFFNLEEMNKLPGCGFEVYDKLDGSLGIIYWDGLDGEFKMATRGSFESDQAIAGTKILKQYKKYWDWFDKKYSYLFEIIIPENKIVINYGDIKDIFFLAAIDKETGKDVDVFNSCPFLKVKKYNGITDIYKLKSMEEKNKEGFVVRFKDNTRIKIKFAEYVRLHKIITGLSTIGIWEMLREGKRVDKELEKVPDELYKWVQDVVNHLAAQYREIEIESMNLCAKVKDLKTRKKQALKVKDSPYSAIVFKLLDNKEYKDLIWKMIRPHGNNVFKNEV